MSKQEITDQWPDSVELAADAPDHLQSIVKALASWQHGEKSLDDIAFMLKDVSEEDRDAALNYISIRYAEAMRLAQEIEATRGLIAKTLEIPSRAWRITSGPVIRLYGEIVRSFARVLKVTVRAAKRGLNEAETDIPL